MSDRKIFRVTGDDRIKFLNALLTRDVPDTGLAYAALQSPQGKFLADFFLWQHGEAVMMDIATALVDDVLQKLTLYRLRSNVQFEESTLKLSRGVGDPPAGAWPDPRHENLGWRLYSDHVGTNQTDWDKIRITEGIPDIGTEMIVGDSYILEFGFERLNGVDFTKGCFVGQEIVARMKHKTTLRKGLATIRLSGPVTPGQPVVAGLRQIGRLGTVSEDLALAYLRFDHGDTPLTVDNTEVEVLHRWV